jgi:hypothetical protein
MADQDRPARLAQPVLVVKGKQGHVAYPARAEEPPCAGLWR